MSIQQLQQPHEAATASGKQADRKQDYPEALTDSPSLAPNACPVIRVSLRAFFIVKSEELEMALEQLQEGARVVLA